MIVQQVYLNSNMTVEWVYLNSNIAAGEKQLRIKSKLFTKFWCKHWKIFIFIPFNFSRDNFLD